MSDSNSIRSRRRVLVGGAWAFVGIALPIALTLRDLGATFGGDSLLFAVLAFLAAFLANASVRPIVTGESRRVTLAAIPIVLAAIACTPVMAVIVAVIARLADVRRSTRADAATGALERFAAAGMAGTSALVVTLSVGALPASQATSPIALLVIAFVASGAFAVLDLAAHVTVTGSHARSLRGLVRLYARSVVLTTGVVGVGVAVSLPFIGSPLVLCVVVTAIAAGLVLHRRVISDGLMDHDVADQLRDSFERYVPQAIASQLASGSHVCLGGETRMVSVMFCDIRGFTAWAEDHDAQTVIDQLNAVLRGLSEAVLRHGGTLDKFTGDGLMAFWGAPLDQPDHAARACAAAADMHASLEYVNVDRMMRGMEPFTIGIGIATGSAVVGNVGHERRLDYTAVGDTVNLAARLEEATKDFGMPTVISARTARRLLDSPAFDEWPVDLGSILVKGKMQPVAIAGLQHGREVEPEAIELRDVA